MTSKGLKASQLADNIGVNRATVSHILSGRNMPSIDFLKKILNKYTDLNSNWLITGVGYMRNENEFKKIEIFKKVNKVVVFYDDSSFEELKS